MAEISREEAIKCIQNEHCKYCNHYEDEDCDYCYLGKTISDMEKLQKIEEVLKGWNSDNPRDVIHWEKMRMIEQIANEVE